MESNEKSPIIERLCKFIETSGLSTSQFADKAGIPRPSMSQMLHGRNKSLNNHVLSKLNDAFPELNIVWLLFGRGEMRSNTNIEISEPQKSLFTTNHIEHSIKNQQLNSNYPDAADFEQFDQNNVNGSKETNSASEKLFPNINRTESQKQPISSIRETKDTEIITKMINSRVIENEPAKKIASIIVLYTDNSFETFLPSTDS